jgi:hypothetical protein
MKALFVSFYCDTPHFETELELISDLLDEGHEVHVLRCTGALVTCLKNPEHRPGCCRICVSKIDAGLGVVAHPRLTVEELQPDFRERGLPDEFADAEELKQYCFEGANIGRGVYSTLCSRINKDTRFDTHRYAAEVRRELEAAAHAYVAVRELISRHKPDRVYVFNGRFSVCYPVIEASRQAGVDYYTHERGGTPDRYLLRKNALPHDLAFNHREILAAWDGGAGDKRQKAENWYRDRRNGVEESWEFNSTMEEYASIKGWEPTLYADEVQGLRQIVASLSAHSGVHVYLRVHPNLKNIPRADNYQLREYLDFEKQFRNLTIIWPESAVHTYALLDACKVTLTFGSTIGAEACFWKKPSILAGRSLYEQLDCCHRPRNHDELMALLLGEAPEKDILGALKYAYWETVRGTPFRRFTPTSLYTGEFNGRVCRPSLSARLHSAVLSVLGH